MRKNLLVVAVILCRMAPLVADTETTESSFTGDRDYASTAVLSGSADKLLAFEPQPAVPEKAQYSEPTLWRLLGLPGTVVCGFLAVGGSIAAIVWLRGFLKRERLRRDIWGELAVSGGETKTLLAWFRSFYFGRSRQRSEETLEDAGPLTG